MPRYRFVCSFSALLLVLSPLSMDDDHTVEPGDTLIELAEANDTTVSAIIAANDLNDPDVIYPGEVLRIPGSSVFHVVQPEETLAVIAGIHGTTAEAIAAANGIMDPDLIFSGTRLRIGGAPSVPVIAGDSFEYVVVAGDTLGSIAARFGASSSEIAARNGLTDPNALRPGQTLTLSGSAFTCPVANAAYSNDFGFVKPDGRLHQGIDMFAAGGAPVVAPAAGRVDQIDGQIGGLQFWLYGADGNVYIGTHMSGFGVSGRVAAGDLVGFVGDSGNARGTSPHLHFEMVVNGEHTNPYPTLRSNDC